MDDRFIYMLLPLPFAIWTLFVWLFRKDLRSRILKVGAIGAVAGILNEILYFQDYWQPVSLFGTGVFSLEDMLSGAFIMAFSVTVYDVVFRIHDEHEQRTSYRRFFILFGVGLLLTLILTYAVGMYSIIATSIGLFVLTAYMLIRRPLLWKRSLFTAASLVLFGFIDYFFLFYVLSPGYLMAHFLLTDTLYNPTFFGFMPFFEVLWFATWGMFAGILIPYLKKKSI